MIPAAPSAAKCGWCRSLGADLTFEYSRENLREAVKAATGGQGVDVVYDPVGGEYSEPAMRSIAWRGRYLVIGFAAGPIPALPLNLALLKEASIVGVFWGEFVRREPKAGMAAMVELSQWYAKGLIKPVIDLQLPMRELAQAYRRMATREVLGKIVMVND